MRLHASFATHTLKKQAEVYPPPHCAVLYEESFNLKPCFRIYYIYIFPSRLVLIMNLHTVCFVHGKQTNPSKLKIQAGFFLQRLLTPLRSKTFFFFFGTCSTIIICSVQTELRVKRNHRLHRSPKDRKHRNVLKTYTS